MFTNPMQFDMYQYGATPSTFYPSGQPPKVSVDYSTTTNIDPTDRRRRRSASTSASSKDKENLSNMHLVRD